MPSALIDDRLSKENERQNQEEHTERSSDDNRRQFREPRAARLRPVPLVHAQLVVEKRRQDEAEDVVPEAACDARARACVALRRACASLFACTTLRARAHAFRLRAHGSMRGYACVAERVWLRVRSSTCVAARAWLRVRVPMRTHPCSVRARLLAR